MPGGLSSTCPGAQVNHTSKRRLLVGSIGVWSAIVVLGVLSVADRDSRPGATGSAPRAWPAHSTLVRSRERSNVLLFAHPHCPCTRASLRELEQVVSRAGERASVQVVLCVPDGAPLDFARTDLWQLAEAIPGVHVSAHAASDEARRFEVRTSGEVLAFDADGQLRFQGGITGSRGHEGDNAGRDALIAALQEPRGELRTSPVFGCSLFDDAAPERAPAAESNASP